MGSNQSKTSARPIMPGLKFRVLVLGRANAGKTTILQRVCETTESPKIYRGGEEVRHGDSHFYSEV
jgi:GTPase SAR1 family protein